MAGTASGGARRSRLAPYLLVAPGILWLLVFFVAPTITLAQTSFTGVDGGWTAYEKALTNYGTHFFRSFRYALAATLLAVAMGYPLAYFIAFRAGRLKNLLLGLVVLPFFTTFLVRTFAWKTILNDGGPAVWLLQRLHVLGEGGRLLDTTIAVVGGLTYNFLPFMILPIYVSLEKIDRRLVEAAEDLYSTPDGRVPQGGAAALAPGRVRGKPADLHPGRRRLHQRAAARQSQPADDRNRHPEPVPRGARLPAGRVAVVRADGGDHARRAGLRAGARHRGSGLMRRLVRWLMDGYAILVLLYLFLPIFVIILYSFNKPAGKFNFVWKSFSLDAWRNPFAYEALYESMKLSLRVAAFSTLVATIFGTLIALALTRYKFRGSGAVNLLLVLPLTTPEVVLGSSLLSLFLDLNVRTGFNTIVIAHIMFSVSYVALTVRARIRGFDWTLEEAAMDLGAEPFRVFTKVTLPIIAPGIVAAAMLAFALSLDDFIITLFNAGNRVTYPLYVYGARRAAFPPQINVLATAILLLSLLALGATVLWQQRTLRQRGMSVTPLA